MTLRACTVFVHERTFDLYVYIACRPSFVLVILGFTAVAFVAGALSWWAPIYLSLGFELNPSPGIMRESARYVSCPLCQ